MQKIIFENYGPFYGIHKLDTYVTYDKPLILFKAENDVAKTSILQSVSFALYGTLSTREKIKNSTLQKRRIINRRAAMEKSPENSQKTSVQIVFTHGTSNDQWTITRTLEFKPTKELDLNTEWSDEDLPEIINEETKIMRGGELKFDTQSSAFLKNSLPEYINTNFLPYDVREFFFFDGMKIQNYTTDKPTPSITDSVKKLLGIQQLINAENDLNKVSKTLETKHGTALANSQEHKSESAELHKEAAELETIKNQIESYQAEIISLDNSIHDAEDFLSQQEGLEKEMRLLKESRAIEDKLKLEIAYQQEKKMDFNNSKLIRCLFHSYLNSFDNSSQTTSYSNEELRIIETSLNSSKCKICNQEIQSEEKNKLEQLLKQVSPIENTRNQIKNLMYEEGDGKTGPKNELLQILVAIDGNQQLLDKEKDNQQELNDKVDVNAQEILLEQVTKRKAELDKNRGKKEALEKVMSIEQEGYSTRKSDLRVSQKTLSRKYKDTNVKFAEAALIRCQNLQKTFSNTIKHFVDAEREDIRRLAEEYFLKGTNNPQLYTGLWLDDDYRIYLELSTMKGRRPAWSLGASAGQSSIISLAFVAALRKKSRNEAPIIIDTPLGMLDWKHTDTAVNFWPKIGGQVIILYQPKELDKKSIIQLEPYTSLHHEAKRHEDKPDCSYIKPWDGEYENRGDGE